MPFWVYENTIHKFARVHDAACSFCSDGRGLFGGGKRHSGSWRGPFGDLSSAVAAARLTRQVDVRGCTYCLGETARIAAPRGAGGGAARGRR
jgi:hypothetical protein